MITINIAFDILDKAITDGHPHTKEDLDKVKADIWAHGLEFAAKKWSETVHPINAISREAIDQLVILSNMAA